jgi:MFS family permease
MPSDHVVRRTQIADVARSVPMGVILPLETSVLLTIAIKQFDSPGWVKGVIASAMGVGMLASPMLTAGARRSSRPVMQVASAATFVGVIAFALGASGSEWLFVLGAVAGIAAIDSVVPLMTSTYQSNFPSDQRGSRVGWGLSARVLVSALVGLAMGSLLRSRLDLWWLLMLAGSVAALAVTLAQLAIPSTPIERVPGVRNSPLPHFHLLAEDRRLRLTLGAWMLMGFGNLMLLPLRVEYLANPDYGIAADAAFITLVTVAIPSVVRLVCLPFFGRVFDRVTFFSARIVVNVLFAAYVAAFFSGGSTLGLVIGALVLGVATAGGDLMWSLWVTKFAPPERTADYMGLHTFLTGLRAVTAPLLGFLIIERMSIEVVAAIAAGLMVLASAMLWPEAKLERQARAAIQPS